MKSKEKLETELMEISNEIHKAMEKLSTSMPDKDRKELEMELKQLRWQALFYIETLNNIK